MTPKTLLKNNANYKLLIFSIILVFSVCNSIYAQTVSQDDQTFVSKNYRIGVGDILKVLVPKQEILSLDNVRVSNDGTIRLPLVNEEIPAACLTEAELSEAVNKRYEEYLLDPQVYIVVQEFHSNPVSVLGAVIAPGRFDVQRPIKLLELLTYVKGPTQLAGDNIQIFRSPENNLCERNVSADAETENKQELIILPLAETLKGSESANPYVQSGDIITITEAKKPGEAYIIGNVKSAKIITLDEPKTLSQAIAMAGGVTGGAQIDKIRISRQDPKTLSKTEIIANLKEINKDNQTDILLQPNDIIEVPGPSGTKKFLRELYKTIIPTVTRGIVPIL
jgi:polysaccharide export outer membrane protein